MDWNLKKSVSSVKWMGISTLVKCFFVAFLKVTDMFRWNRGSSAVRAQEPNLFQLVVSKIAMRLFLCVMACVAALRERSDTDLQELIVKPDGHPHAALNGGFSDSAEKMFQSIIEEEFSHDMLHWERGIYKRVKEEFPKFIWNIFTTTMPSYAMMPKRKEMVIFTWGNYKFWFFPEKNYK